MERGFFVFTVSIRSQRGQEGHVAMPTARAASLRETPSIQLTKTERGGGMETFSGANPSVDGQGYIPSQQVQRLGCWPAIRDPL